MGILREKVGNFPGIFQFITNRGGEPNQIFLKISLFSWVQKGGINFCCWVQIGGQIHTVEYKMGTFCLQLSTIWAFLQACKGKLPYKNTHC